MTKTYIASAVLRLWEDGHLGLKDTIHQYLDHDITASLISASYDTSNITIDQLLYHVSGFLDSNSDMYLARVMADPQHNWTRHEQVKFIVDNEQKIGDPGEKYSYSDIGYVLLAILSKTSQISRKYQHITSFSN